VQQLLGANARFRLVPTIESTGGRSICPRTMASGTLAAKGEAKH